MREHRSYDETTKAEAVGRSLAVGSKRVSAETGIPRRTIDYWINSPDFASLRQRAREDVAEAMWVGVQIAVHEVIEGVQSPKAMLRDKAQALQVLATHHALLTGAATGRTETRDLTGTLSDTEVRDALREAERLLATELAPGAPAGTPEG